MKMENVGHTCAVDGEGDTEERGVVPALLRDSAALTEWQTMREKLILVPHQNVCLCLTGASHRRGGGRARGGHMYVIILSLELANSVSIPSALLDYENQTDFI